MTTVTKMDLTDSLSSRQKMETKEAKSFIEAVFDTLAEALADGEEVKISGFGNFSVREKAARPGRNPRTGEEALVSARRVVTFHPGQKLRARVEDVNLPESEE